MSQDKDNTSLRTCRHSSVLPVLHLPASIVDRFDGASAVQQYESVPSFCN